MSMMSVALFELSLSPQEYNRSAASQRRQSFLIIKSLLQQGNIIYFCRQPQKIHFQKFGCDRRAGSSLKEANTSSIRLFSFLPALGLAQIFLIKAIFFGRLRSPHILSN
jgi:hypothetical protein